MGPGGGGLPQLPGNQGGQLTGPNPTDRGRPGGNHHLVTVDGLGAPLANLPTPANVPDAAALASGLAHATGPDGEPPRVTGRLDARWPGDGG